MSLVVTLASLVMLSTTASFAQRADTLVPGVRLRLRPLPQSEWEYGTFRDIFRDSLDMELKGSQTTRRYALTEIAALEAYRESEGALSRHAEIGAIAGALVATAFLLRDVDYCAATDRHSDGPSCGFAYVALPVVALGGAAAGAIVGALGPTGRWRTVDVAHASR